MRSKWIAGRRRFGVDLRQAARPRLRPRTENGRRDGRRKNFVRRADAVRPQIVSALVEADFRRLVVARAWQLST